MGLTRQQLDAAVVRRFKDGARRMSPQIPAVFRDAVDAFIDDSPGLKLPRGVWREVLKRLAIVDLIHSSTPISDAAEVCESPIEELMLLALCMMGRQPEGLRQVRCNTNWRTMGEVLDHLPSADGEALYIYPQINVAGYRVDFLLCSWPVAGSGRRMSEPLWLVVECDGHEFHERTSRQAERDKAMDRALQSRHFAVFRFTGSKVWNDPFGSANEVIAFLDGSKGRPTRKSLH